VAREVAPDWYDGFFDDDWLTLLQLRATPERNAAEVNFVVEALALLPGERVLDVACGFGRHSVELALRGMRVTGLDLSAPSLERARAAAREARVDVDFVHGDMRQLPWAREFDAAINLFSSFGYFATEAEDQGALDEIARALKPGGRFLLETAHIFGIVRQFRARWWDDLPDGQLLLEDREFDLLSGRNLVSWTFVEVDGSRRELRHSFRFYTPAELVRMLETAGLSVEQAWGGYDASELTLESPRLALHARRLADLGA
jgi:SAM-dependent methyltransferase